MRRYWQKWSLPGLLYLLAALSGVAEESLRIATYNVRNYLVMDRYSDSGWRPEYPKPEAEKSAVREVIKAARPDILALQELGPRPFLEELRADLELEGEVYPYAFHLRGADAARHVAVLSKVAPIEVIEHRDLEFKYFDSTETVKRGMLELSFATGEGPAFRLFVVHLKSRWTDRKDDPESTLRRTREAEACRDRILERTLELGLGEFLIAGDFNSVPGSAPMRRFEKKGKRAIAQPVPAYDSRAEVWTYYYEKAATYSRVDGFLVSEALSGRIQGGAGRIVDIPEALTGSDHRLVYLDLN